MKRLCMIALACVAMNAASLTGTWIFSVDLETGDHGDAVFEIKEANGRIIGKYTGEFGEQTVFGTVDGKTVKLRVAASGVAGTVGLDYAGTLDGDKKLSGTMTRNLSGKVTAGKWTAVRKE